MMHAVSKSFLYQINVTRDCNLRCSHCYIHTDTKVASKEISASNAIRLAGMIREHMLSTNKTRAEIHFVGGEPSMLGLRWFEEVVPKFKEELFLDAGGRFSADIILVTNLLSADAVQIAKLFDRVSTSWEPQTRFIGRTGAFKPKLEKLWERHVSELLDANIDIGVTTAITAKTIALGATNVLDYLSGIGFRQIHLGFFIPEGDGLENFMSVHPRFHETSCFLIDSANWAVEKRDDGIWVNPFESLLFAIHSNEIAEDVICPIITGSIDINWDGGAVSCLESGGSKTPVWHGNVFEQGVRSVVDRKDFRSEIRSAIRGSHDCLVCDERPICMSGCGKLAAFRTDEDRDCHGFKSFIKHVRHLYEHGVKPKEVRLKSSFC